MLTQSPFFYTNRVKIVLSFHAWASLISNWSKTMEQLMWSGGPPWLRLSTTKLGEVVLFQHSLCYKIANRLQ